MDQFYPPVYWEQEDQSMVLPGGGEDDRINTDWKPNKHKEMNNMRK